jgi:hypothetical protein
VSAATLNIVTADRLLGGGELAPDRRGACGEQLGPLGRGDTLLAHPGHQRRSELLEVLEDHRAPKRTSRPYGAGARAGCLLSPLRVEAER